MLGKGRKPTKVRRMLSVYTSEQAPSFSIAEGGCYSTRVFCDFRHRYFLLLTLHQRVSWMINWQYSTEILQCFVLKLVFIAFKPCPFPLWPDLCNCTYHHLAYLLPFFDIMDFSAAVSNISPTHARKKSSDNQGKMFRVLFADKNDTCIFISSAMMSFQIHIETSLSLGLRI